MEDISVQSDFDYAELEDKMQVEAALFMTPEGLSAELIAQRMPTITKRRAAQILFQIAQDYQNYGGGLRVVSEDGTTFKFDIIHPIEAEPEIQKIYGGNQFTPNEIKTLAFIGYNQPVEYQDIVDFLGTSVKKPIKSLLAQQLIEKTDNKSAKMGEFITSRKFAVLLDVENKPEIIKSQIKYFMA
jgi:chromosome segregation and condensation protein ScpB